MDDKRKVPRRRVLKEGKIVYADGLRVLDCTIRDISENGARLLIANTVGLPDKFQLFEKSSGLLYPASIAWRQANAIGVQFDGPATSIHDPANKRFARLKFAVSRRQGCISRCSCSASAGEHRRRAFDDAMHRVLAARGT